MSVEQLIEKAMKRSDGAQASLSRGESTSVSFESNRLKHARSSQGTRVSLKVVVDGKVGTSSSTGADDLDGLVSRAVEAAAFGSPIHFELPGPADADEVRLSDAAVPAVSQSEMVDIGQEMLDMLRARDADLIVHSGVGKASSRYAFANSAGAAYETEGTSFSLGVHGQLTRGSDMLSVGHYAGWRARDIDHVAVAEHAVEWLRLAEKNASIQSGRMPVIFPPESLHVLLLALEMGVNGKNVFLGNSPLAGKLGERIADERLTIVDDPSIDYASGSGRYDGEGVPHRRLPIVENGVLSAFLYDLDTAGRAGAETTGHGVGCGPTNTVIAAGDTPYEAMIRDTKEGLLVRSVLGLGQGNAISGEFSVNVHLGYKIENGEIAGRVKDVMLSGNTYDALKSISAIGDRAEWVGGSLLAPPIMVDGLSVTAK